MSKRRLFVEDSSDEDDVNATNENLMIANELSVGNIDDDSKRALVNAESSNVPKLGHQGLDNHPLDKKNKEFLYGGVLDDTDENDDGFKIRAVSDDEDTANNVRVQDEDRSLKPKFNIKDIKPVDVQLGITVPFQQLIVQDMLVSEDPLLILGKGLGTESITSSLLYILSTPTNFSETVKKQSLVLLLNCTPEDNLRLEEELVEISWLSEDQVERDFHIVSSETSSVEKRKNLYLKGGIVSVTSRILIVDILSNIIDLKTVTGLMILHVENLDNNSNISFITEMYREVNKWGFIKGISDSVNSFVTKGFQPLHSKLKQLKLKNPILWPRFHAQISQSLNVSESKVTEVRVALTDSMQQIQFGIYECLKKCLDELNRKTMDLEMNEYWCLDNALDSGFMKSMSMILEPQWHRISFETKQLVKDISTLRKLMTYLVTYDSLDFYEIIKMISDANKPSITRKYVESLWLLCDESQLVISNAKRRVSQQGQYILEPQPKWEQLLAVLEDINFEREHDTNSQSGIGPTLIMCSSTYTVQQLKKITSLKNKDAIRKYMMEKLNLFMDNKNNNKIRKVVKDLKENSSTIYNTGVEPDLNELQPDDEKHFSVEQGELIDNDTNVSVTFSRGAMKDYEKIRNSKRRRTRGASYVAAVNKLKDKTNGEDIESTMDEQEIKKEIIKLEGQIESDDCQVISDDDETQFGAGYNFGSGFAVKTEREVWENRINSFDYIDKNDQIVVERFFNKESDSFLEELMPSYIILYEPDLTFIRKVELYRAVHPNTKIYFMYYRDSAEEQHHLTEIKKEKEAFTKLIKERVNLAKHFEATEDLSRYKNLVKMNLHLSNRKNSSRIAGGQNSKSPSMNEMCVVVDTREFNASLPGLLYRYGIKVIPCMLTVGDYILTPNICIERKSISDLIGSLKNGRLVEQCKKMTKHYKYPTLLIEFSDNQSFSLEPFSETRRIRKVNSHPIAGQLMQDEIQKYLAKVIMRFPSLSIVWSSSPLQTVNIILDLKKGREEPDPAECLQIGKKASKTKSKNILKPVTDDLEAESDEDLDILSYAKDQNELKKLLDVSGLANVDYYKIVSSVKDYNELSQMPLDQIVDIIGDVEVSEKIFQFIKNDLEKT